MATFTNVTELHGRWRMADYLSQWIERDDNEANNAPMLAALLPGEASANGTNGDAAGPAGKFTITVEFTPDE